jgi:hypothetical protein
MLAVASREALPEETGVGGAVTTGGGTIFDVVVEVDVAVFLVVFGTEAFGEVVAALVADVVATVEVAAVSVDVAKES